MSITTAHIYNDQTILYAVQMWTKPFYSAKHTLRLLHMITERVRTMQGPRQTEFASSRICGTKRPNFGGSQFFRYLKVCSYIWPGLTIG